MKEKYINETIKLAKKANKKGEVPIGAIIVKNNKIIGKGYNRVEHTICSLHHAEMLAISQAQRKQKNWRLNNCTIYVSLQPCLMCLNAIIQARIKNIVYFQISNFLSFEEQKIFAYQIKKHKINCQKCESKIIDQNIISDFFKQRRK